MPFHWIILLAAVAVEVLATSALKVFVSAPLFLAFLPLVLIGLSFALLSLALRVIPMAVAYAVWEGLGIVGIALIGHVLFAEHLTPGRLLALAMIVGGIVLLERGVGHDELGQEELGPGELGHGELGHEEQRRLA